MAKERAYKEHLTEANFICFKADERWRNIKNLADGSYYISDKGRVMRLNPYGIFNEIKSHVFEGAYYVTVEHLNKNKRIPKRHNIARLVLQNFTGGDNPSGRRRFVYLDGDKSNCRLSNLRWKVGFANGVDFWYLRKIVESSLNKDDRIVRRFLLLNDVKEMINLIMTKEALIRSIDRNHNFKYLDYNDYMDFVMLVIDNLLEGKYKPSKTNHSKPKYFTNYMVLLFKRIAYEFCLKENKTVLLRDENFAIASY